MPHLYRIPSINKISDSLFKCAPNYVTPLQLQEFLCALSHIDQAEERLVAWSETSNDTKIIDMIWKHIYDNSTEKMSVLEGCPFILLCGYFAGVLKNGFPEKYLKKNDMYWFGDYYLPYAPHLLFAAGVASMAASKFF
jgi:hypothetical protein